MLRKPGHQWTVSHPSGQWWSILDASRDERLAFSVRRSGRRRCAGSPGHERRRLEIQNPAHHVLDLADPVERVKLRRPDRRQATVTLETPRDLDRVSSFLNIRVRDIEAVYAEWSARGADFLTPPKQDQYEIRYFIRDPDGYLIEVGQTTGAT